MRLASQGLDLGWAGLSDDVGAVKAALASPSLAPTAKTVRGMCDFHLFVLYACGCMHNYCPNCMRLNSKIRKVCCATKLNSLGEGNQFNPQLQQRRQQPKPLANVKWAHGVVVSHPHSGGPGFNPQCVHFGRNAGFQHCCPSLQIVTQSRHSCLQHFQP